MSEQTQNENPQDNVLQFKKLSFENAIENIYNTVSQKIPLDYEESGDKKFIKIPRLQNNHLDEFEKIIRDNIKLLKSQGTSWDKIEDKFQGILDYIIPIFKTNALRLEDESISEKIDFQQYYQIWERILKEEKELVN